MSEPVLTAAQTRAAVQRIGENLALRSGAGCGKTFVLARRFTELLLADRGAANPLSRLVALTFTEKAALEMVDRVRRFLCEAADRAAATKPRSDDCRRLREWLDGVDEARISTIHSFCASLLRSAAVEAGIDPAFTVCSDELLSAQMTTEAAEQAVLEAIEQGREDVAALMLRGSLDGLIGTVCTLVEKRTAADLAAHSDAQATLRRWGGLIDQHREQARKDLAGDEKLRGLAKQLRSAADAVTADDKLADFIHDKLAQVEAILAHPDSAAPADFEGLRTKPGNVGAPKAWGSKEAVKAARGGIKELAEMVDAYSLCAERMGLRDEQAARALATLAGLALRADELYAAAKRTRGVLDFEDLLIHAERLLRTHPDLCRSLSDGLGQMLIDECQDTNAFQVRLLERLVRGGEGELGEGRIFLVGDAKQSIYRFRGAQVEVFEDWCRRLGPRHQEELDESFRTHDAAAAFVNHLFAKMMPDYAPLRAHRHQVPPAQCVEVLLAEGPDGQPIDTADEAVAAQAAVVAERIEQMVADKERRVWDAGDKQWRAVRAGDIAILFARMTASLEYERALAERDIPRYVVAGSGFFRQQEVYDVLNALRVIDNPFDDVALAGALRSSLFGLDDNALLRLAHAAQPPYWAALAAGTRPEGLGGAMRQALERAVATFARLHRDKDALGIDRLIEEVLTVTGYEATLPAQSQGRRMVGNVRMLLDQARAAAAEGLALADFVARMDELVLHERRYEQAPVAGEAENVVRLMTIHKAKGLEFPVVFLPDLNAAHQGEKSAILGRSDWGLVYKLAAEEGEESEDLDSEGAEDGAAAQELPLSFRLAKKAEDADQDREDVRKLYVAVTRAKDHVVLVGANWRSSEKGEFHRKGSFLRRIDEVLDIRGALEAGRSSIPYGDGRFQAAVRVVSAAASSPRAGGRSAGQRILAAAKGVEDVAEKLLAAAPKGVAPPPLLGALPVETARTELAVTALVDFAACPMLYRWQHELRVGREFLPAPAVSRQRPAALDPATLGTLLHQCMELLDFTHPQAARALVTAAACQLELEETADLDAVAAEFQAMLDRFRAQPLWATLASAAAILRELDFCLSLARPGSRQVGPVALRGQIDLLVQDAAGAWRIVDYKSDRVEVAAVAEHARRYELQVLAYATAARRHLGSLPAEAVLYFLRPGTAHRVPLTPNGLAAAEQRLAATAEELVAARRSGRFQRRRAELCAACPYRALCQRHGAAGP